MLSVGAPPASHAEQLPFRHYGAAEGLAGSSVHAIYQDRSGYLLVGGAEGLSRFDGYRFVTRGVRDGLGHPFVGAIAEDREGRLWVGTNGGGVARWPEEGAKFVNSRIGESVASNRVNEMAFDADNTLWCVTDGGLYRGDPGTLRFEAVVPRGVGAAMPLLVDSRGRVWAGIYKELALVERGQVTSWTPPELVAEHHVRAIVEEPPGRILAANHFGLFEYRPPARGAGKGGWARLPLSLAPLQQISSMWAAPDGVLWIGTTHGLIQYKGGRQALYTTANGLKSDIIWALFGDRDENLWIGTSAGLVRLAGEAAVSWTVADGLPDVHISRVHEARDGRIYASTSRGGVVEIVGSKAVLVPGSHEMRFRRIPNLMNTQLHQDRHGDWWVVTQSAVYRFRGPGLQFQEGRLFGAGDGLPQGTLFSGYIDGIHEDPAGRIWIGSRYGLFLYDPSKRRAPRFDFLPFVGFAQPDEVNDVVGLRSGTVWFMTHVNLARVVDGRIEPLWPTDARPKKRPYALFVDSRDRVWFGLIYGGLWMTAEADAERGARELPPLSLGASNNNLLIEYVALSFRSEGSLRYQYRLDGQQRGSALGRFERGDRARRRRRLAVAEGGRRRPRVRCRKSRRRERGRQWSAQHGAAGSGPQGRVRRRFRSRIRHLHNGPHSRRAARLGRPRARAGGFLQPTLTMPGATLPSLLGEYPVAAPAPRG